jgi:oligoendopeptidase F
MTTATENLPRWDMTPLFPSLESPEFRAAFQGVIDELGRLERLFEELGVRRLEAPATGASHTRALEDVARALNDYSDRSRTVSSYISSFISTDSRNDLAQARQSELQGQFVRFAKLNARFTAWVGSLDLDALLAESQYLREHEFALRKSAERAAHQMSPAEEDLAASLNPTGSGAWGKLHGNLTSRLKVRVEMLDGAKELPMSAVRGLARHTDRRVRESAYRAELGAWETVALPLAAALNSIKGEVGVLAERRGWSSPLEASLFVANIDRETLDAMQTACQASFPDFRRYFQAKSRLLGNEGPLPWWDLFAPVGDSGREWTYGEASNFIVEQFGAYSPRMADFAKRAFDENWIDVPPRDGKRDGAFCMGVRGEESRILLNFEPSLNSVSTLAHELGHGYHNLNLGSRTMLQRQTPMTLAETASIFCETIVKDAAVSRASGPEKLAIIEAELQSQAQVVVDIHSRFLLETGVFEGRRQRELSVSELNELMLEAQRQTYGDGLDSTVLHPYMWAVKGHYYSGALSYYNYPYTFGLLYGLGLYARYRQDPEGFKASYDDMLSSTGLADAATLAGRYGINLRDEGFWTASLDVIRENIAEFERLATESRS